MSSPNDNSPQSAKEQTVIDLNQATTQSVDAQAAAWLAKLDADDVSKDDLATFKRWVNLDASHREAFEDLLEFCGDLNILTQVDSPSQTATSWFSFSGFKTTFKTAYGMSALAACSVAFVALVVVLLLPPESTMYTTAIGEQKTIELADRSTVLLNTDTRIRVTIDRQQRRVELLRGDAHFAVAHNSDKPFDVLAGEAMVRAVGTAFSVHLRRADINVVVTEGVVAIDKQPALLQQLAQSPQEALVTTAEIPGGDISNDKALPMVLTVAQQAAVADLGAAMQLVSAGNQAAFDVALSEPIQLSEVESIEDTLAWHRAMLVFKGEPLADVVVEVSRYTAMKIVIPERETRQLKVGGLFKVGDTQSMFEALYDGFGIKAEYVSDNVVMLIMDERR